MNYLICRGDDETRINVDEISTIIIQNIGVSLTAALLSRLMEGNVKVIFCDPKSNPQGELVPYYGSFDSFSKITIQSQWKPEVKGEIWKLIVKEKIGNQKKNLTFFYKDHSDLLSQYQDEVQFDDASNREGHAAKVYFTSCFGLAFSRDSDSEINKYLNYGYSIVLSAINRCVKSFGYLTELGIHHIGQTNPYNLSCDLMEPLRAYIDSKVLSGKLNEDSFKESLIAVLNDKVVFEGSEMFLDNAVHDYVQTVLIALREGDPGKVRFLSYELA